MRLFETRSARFSEDRRYRYMLRIVWDSSLPVMCSIGLNPSVADEWRNDHTIVKECTFAQILNCGGMVKLNAFALVATNPKHLYSSDDPIGPENTIQYIHTILCQCLGPHIAAWGKHGRFLKRDAELRSAFPTLKCFGINKDGTPTHPLMLPYTTKLVPYAL